MKNKKDKRVSSYYLDFKEKYGKRITDAPSIDRVVDFYLENKDKVNFSNLEDGSYSFLVDMKESEQPTLGEWFDGYFFVDMEELSKKFPDGYIKMLPLDGHNFINFDSENNKSYFYPDQCKLWINTNLNNCFDIAVELAKFIDENHLTMSKDGKDSQTCYKISTHYERNDAVTIYTNYMEVDSLIGFLNDLKQRRPELFETNRKANPLITKIDNFISYADVTHATSSPALICEALQDINKFKKDIDETPKDKQKDLVKSLILKRILERTNYGFCHVDSMLNTDNFCSKRLNDVSFDHLTHEEAEAQREKLQKEVDRLENKINYSAQIEM